MFDYANVPILEQEDRGDIFIKYIYHRLTEMVAYSIRNQPPTMSFGVSLQADSTRAHIMKSAMEQSLTNN